MNLLESLEEVTDPRDPRGVRHPVPALLKATLLGLLAGKTCTEHIAAYIAEHWDEVADPLGFTRWHPPGGDTYRRVLGQIDSGRLARAFENWMSHCLRGQTLVASVDGKASRGVAGEHPGRALNVLNVFAHDMQVVLAQWPLENKQGESTTLKANLSGLLEKYPGLSLLTADAGFSGRNLAQALVDLHLNYLVRVKGNQPDVEEAMIFWFEQQLQRRVRADAVTCEKKRA